MLALIFTTYFPPAAFQEKINNLTNCCDYIIIVDNTPGSFLFDLSNEKFILLSDGKNKGLAGALNLGIQQALMLGINYVSLFDQDSEVTASLIGNLYASIKQAEIRIGSKVCLGPSHIDDTTDRDLEIKPYHVHQWSLQPITALPTSGMIFSLKDFENDDFFSEAFFLDFVDFEWCWRLRKKGWQVFRISNLFLYHRLGLGEYKILNFKFYKPSPFRHYFQVRDTLNIFILPYAPTYSRFRLLSVIPFKILIYPFIFGNGLERVKWSLLGIKDFYKNISGIGAARSKLG